MESAEPGRKLDLETIKYVPIYNDNKKLHINGNIYAIEPFDFQKHNYEVIAHEY